MGQSRGNCERPGHSQEKKTGGKDGLGKEEGQDFPMCERRLKTVVGGEVTRKDKGKDSHGERTKKKKRNRVLGGRKGAEKQSGLG